MSRACDDSPAAGPVTAAQPRCRRWLWLGGVALLAVIGTNHAEHHLRRQRLRAAAGPAVAVRQEGGVLAGHSSIGIDESAAGTEAFLRFATLAAWAFDPKAPSPCPPAVQAWSGREVACLGFMYPLEPGAELKTFCLLRTTQTCCYGPRPQYNQYLLTEMRAPVRFERLRPVVVHGRFVADPQPQQGFIYRLEGTSCVPAVADEPDADPAESARRAGLPLFDFAWLTGLGAAGSGTVPAALEALHGRPVVVAGFFLERRAGPEPCVLISRDWWDGVSQGVRPTLATALPAFGRDERHLPPVWQDRGAVTGVLQLERDPGHWAERGVVRLRDAVCGVPGRLGEPFATGRGPLVPAWAEVVLVAGFAGLVLTVRRRRRVPSHVGA